VERLKYRKHVSCSLFCFGSTSSSSVRIFRIIEDDRLSAKLVGPINCNAASGVACETLNPRKSCKSGLKARRTSGNGTYRDAGTRPGQRDMPGHAGTAGTLWLQRCIVVPTFFHTFLSHLLQYLISEHANFSLMS
jgi:hypothetical protein